MPITLASQLVPKNSNTWYLIEDIYLKGGLQVFADTTARDAINPANKKAGMIAITQNDKTIWQLGDDLTTWSIVPVQGPAGPQGATGPQGPAGPQGIPGNAAVGNTLVTSATIADNSLFSLALDISSLATGKVPLSNNVRLANNDVSDAQVQVLDSTTQTVLQTNTIPAGKVKVLDFSSITNLKIFARAAQLDLTHTLNYL